MYGVGVWRLKRSSCLARRVHRGDQRLPIPLAIDLRLRHVKRISGCRQGRRRACLVENLRHSLQPRLVGAGCGSFAAGEVPQQHADPRPADKRYGDSMMRAAACLVRADAVYLHRLVSSYGVVTVGATGNAPAADCLLWEPITQGRRIPSRGHPRWLRHRHRKRNRLDRERWRRPPRY